MRHVFSEACKKKRALFEAFTYLVALVFSVMSTASAAAV